MGGRISDVASAPAGKFTRQYAALPFRRSPRGELEFLLLTSRETRRWVLPKGWPIKALTPGASAAREAFEEAGLFGVVLGDKIGTYRYDKRLPKGAAASVDVNVFLFRVTRQAKKWPEKDERQSRWCSPAEAASLVAEVGLAQLLLAAPAQIAQAEQAAYRALPKAV